MVSKVAVIALVAIVACPILMGYAMNLDQVTHTEYAPAEDSTVNVTPLLQTSTAYNYTHADPYSLNTNFVSSANCRVIPVYNKISSVKSAYPLIITQYSNQSWVNALQAVADKYFYEEFNYDPATSSHSITIQAMVNNVLTDVMTIPYIHSFYYDSVNQKYEYTFYYNTTTLSGGFGVGDVRSLKLNSYSGTADVIVSSYASNRYADLTAGTYFRGNLIDSRSLLPANTKSVLLTVNLNSITDANYSVLMEFTGGGYYLQKSTVGGVVSWKAINQVDSSVIDLYYDVSRNNVYQIYVDVVKTNQDASYYYMDSHREFRYVGDWPSTFGEANYYLKYEQDCPFTSSTNYPEPSFGAIRFIGSYTYDNRTPLIRIDDAMVQGFEYSIIENQTYNPSAFKANPSTTIKDITEYGVSLSFAGNTYAVTDGNITMGTHQIPVKNIVFDSIPSGLNTYDNRINGTVVSTTATPSTIVFNGKWAASIQTTEQTLNTYTTTEWTPGHFGWDGIDTNFLIVGLLISLGTFIAIGIYIRKTGKGLWPALIVCGGAVIIFFCML